MRHLRLSVLSVLAAALLCGPAVPLQNPTPQDDMVTKHKWDAIPGNWTSIGLPPPDTTIDLHIALQPNQKAALTDALLEVSQPGHPKYGAHLSIEQVAELVAPHPNTLELVTTWLEHSGVPTSSISRTLAGGWLVVTDVPVSQANELLGASYQLYYHAGRDDTILRTAGYALPGALHEHVKTVVPTTAFTSTRLLQQTSGHRSGEAAASNVTSAESVNMLPRRPPPSNDIEVSVLRSMYHTATYEPNPALTGNRLGIVGHNDEFLTRNDLFDFMERYRYDARLQTIDFKTIDPNLSKGKPSFRASIFTQYAGAMAFPIPITFYRGTGAGKITKKRKRGQGDDAVFQFLKYTDGRQDIPQTIGLVTDGTTEMNISHEYAQSVCKEFEILGARGVTVLVGTGDNGVGPEPCYEFSINFPASCPFVTAVGGTVGTPPEPEVGVYFSGGGFSRHFDRPNYQKYEVGTYIHGIRETHSGLYKRSGRGVPDIALKSSEYAYIWRAKRRTMEGTVCSTSTAVGIFSLLNDYRLSVGLGPFGWVNPWLYGVGSFGFNDITSGNNPGCGTEGFEAKVGWDPVTGLGSPDVKQLINILHPIIQPSQSPQTPQPPQPSQPSQPPQSSQPPQPPQTPQPPRPSQPSQPPQPSHPSQPPQPQRRNQSLHDPL